MAAEAMAAEARAPGAEEGPRGGGGAAARGLGAELLGKCRVRGRAPRGGAAPVAAAGRPADGAPGAAPRGAVGARAAGAPGRGGGRRRVW